jgi:hypothetical protein
LNTTISGVSFPVWEGSTNKKNKKGYGLNSGLEQRPINASVLRAIGLLNGPKCSIKTEYL